MTTSRNIMASNRPRRKHAARLAAVLTAAATFMAGCSDSAPEPKDQSALDYFGYQLPVPLITTNAATKIGDSLKMQRLSGRIFPGAFIPGPSGQRIPNTDLVSTQVLPGPQRQVVYTLSDQAEFSDGVPVTCDDYALAFAAGSNPDVFSSHMPQMEQVERVDCTPGSKKFTVVFQPGKGGRWRELFSAGTVLPAHAIAKRLGMETADFTNRLQSGDPELLGRTSEVWRFGFALNKFDPELQVSFGPYKIESVGEEGEVVLAANEKYYGDAPEVPKVVVWPSTKDSAELQEAGALMVGDLAAPNPEWYQAPPEPDQGANADDVRTGKDGQDAEASEASEAGESPASDSADPDSRESHQELQTVIGEMTDTLIFAGAGPWAYRDNRQALSKCIDIRAVAEASSREAGIELPPSPVHVLTQNDPMSSRLGDIANPHLDVDIEGARVASGLELHVGYNSPNKRMAAMVEAMKKSCEPAGITITDVTANGKTRGDLLTEEPGWNVEGALDRGGKIDAFLGAVDPLMEYESATSRSEELQSLRAEEKRLWDEVPSIPLSAQPRTFIVDNSIKNVVVYTGPVGIGWNMDRWHVPGLEPTPEQKDDK
ncbi:ABC transporter substrate-binding protein [Corynebacterium appendicis]|uniref:ABC transporter substrate-binding protein n=1 Tax=Corynebacterium appendicis TaxID=163202 RepID=UPI00235481D8|nr:ABC transporter substrate-binding protein [Corynebacterium appendicis]